MDLTSMIPNGTEETQVPEQKLSKEDMLLLSNRNEKRCGQR